MGPLLVFLHGLKGNEETWGLVPELIKRTPGSDFEIAILTYSARVRSPSDLSRSAGVILTELEHKYRGRTAIYLIGYSLGGLIAREVCRQLLVSDQSRDLLLDSVRAAITLGTPIEGANGGLLTAPLNFALRWAPFVVGPKVREIADPSANFRRYKQAISQRVAVQNSDPNRKARRPKQIHIEIEDDVTVAPNTQQYHTEDDVRGGMIRGTHRRFAEDSDSASGLADLLVSLIRATRNATNPAHSPAPSVLNSTVSPSLPKTLVLFACSRTKTPGGDRGHDGAAPASWIEPPSLRSRVVDKRSNVFGLIKDAKIVDAFEKGGNRAHQAGNQDLQHGPDLGGLAAIGERCVYLPAWRRYNGRAYVPAQQSWPNYLASERPFTVLIMSGLYGLIEPNERIQDYDVHLSDTHDLSGQSVKLMWSELYTETIKAYVERAYDGGDRVKVFNLLCDVNYVTAIEWLELPKEKCTVFHLASPTLDDVKLLPAAGTILNRFLQDPGHIARISQGQEHDLSDYGATPKGESDVRVVFDRRFGDTRPAGK